jgi:hypothetical protein
MPTLRIGVSYRPLRIGLLVRSLDHARRAAQMATALWGGVLNPLLLLDDVTPDPLTITSRWMLDFMWDLTGEAEDFLTSHRYVLAPLDIKSAGLIHRERFAVGAASMALPYAHVGLGPKQPTSGVVPIWENEHPCAAFLAVAFGEFGASAGEQDLRARFTATTEAEELTATPDIQPAIFHADARPLDLTMHALEPEPMLRVRPCVFVGDPAKVRDLCLYWNLRALGLRGITFLSTSNALSTVRWVEHELRTGWEAARASAGDEARVDAFFGVGFDRDRAEEVELPGLPAAARVFRRPGDISAWLEEVRVLRRAGGAP